MSRVGPPNPVDIRHASIVNARSLSCSRYAILWIIMMVLHVICAVFLLCCAKLYWIMENEYIDYFANLLAPPRDRHFRVVGVSLGILGGVHLLQFSSHLVLSISARNLTVRPLNFGPDMATCITFILEKCLHLGQWILTRCRFLKLGKHRAALIAGGGNKASETSCEVYIHMFACRKLLEIAMQVLNAYLYSKLITRTWINRVKVGLVVANCWSAFILHRLQLRKGRKTTQFKAVVIDVLLSTATAILLPSAIVMPYMLHFDFATLDFPDAMLYGDTSFPNLVLENRAFFFMSWDKAAIRGVPHVSLFFCLHAIGSMLHSEFSLSKISHSWPKIRLSKKKSIVVVSAIEALTRASDSIHWLMKIFQRVYQTMMPLFFLSTGGIVLALHLIAHHENVQDIEVMSRMCLQKMHPWLAPNLSCAVIKYNCYKEGVVSPPHDVFQWSEREVVRKITFLHCSAFQMPPSIREFQSLMGIELWNVTLVQWGEEAGVSAELHPNMLFLFFSFVNMTEIPAGILSPELPELLTDLEFAHTNLTSLPQAIIKSWKSVEVLYVEHSQLGQFPTIVMQLPALSELSLIDNKFNAIPEEAFSSAASTNYYDLALSHNAIRHLPSKVSFCIFNLALEFTQLEEIPGWIKENVWVSLSLRGSSVCDPSTNIQIPTAAHCERIDPLGEERFPTKIVEPFRALNA